MIPASASTPTPSPASKSLADSVKDAGKALEQDATKYIVAVLAFFFLAALLWVGFKTLQKD